MKTSEFISALRRSPKKELLFTNTKGAAVHRGYHLTEIKAVTYDTVDCGAQKNRWNETILQLWVPTTADDDYMSAGKFVSIYDKVRKLVSIDEEAEVRIEYGDETFFPTAYYVSNFSENEKELRAILEPPATTCKARDRIRNSASESCCA